MTKTSKYDIYELEMKIAQNFRNNPKIGFVESVHKASEVLKLYLGKREQC
jgi:hypothetical protein